MNHEGITCLGHINANISAIYDIHFKPVGKRNSRLSGIGGPYAVNWGCGVDFQLVQGIKALYA